MLKLRKPFSVGTQLHINQGLVQQLWDKYVPASSDSYDRISLIYLQHPDEPAERSRRQYRLTVQLLLNHISIWLNLQKNQTLLCRRILLKSVDTPIRYYMEQLRRTDFHTFRSLEKFISSAGQAAAADRRYENWQKEYRIISDTQAGCRLLEHFSHQLQDLLTVQTARLQQTLMQKLFSSMNETEYRLLSETCFRQEKDQITDYISSCSDRLFQSILLHLEQEPALAAVIQPAARQAAGRQTDILAEPVTDRPALPARRPPFIWPVTDGRQQAVTTGQDIVIHIWKPAGTAVSGLPAGGLTARQQEIIAKLQAVNRKSGSTDAGNLSVRNGAAAACLSVSGNISGKTQTASSPAGAAGHARMATAASETARMPAVISETARMATDAAENVRMPDAASQTARMPDAASENVRIKAGRLPASPDSREKIPAVTDRALSAGSPADSRLSRTEFLQAVSVLELQQLQDLYQNVRSCVTAMQPSDAGSFCYRIVWPPSLQDLLKAAADPGSPVIHNIWNHLPACLEELCSPQTGTDVSRKLSAASYELCHRLYTRLPELHKTYETELAGCFRRQIQDTIYTFPPVPAPESYRNNRTSADPAAPAADRSLSHGSGYPDSTGSPGGQTLFYNLLAEAAGSRTGTAIGRILSEELRKIPVPRSRQTQADTGMYQTDPSLSRADNTQQQAAAGSRTHRLIPAGRPTAAQAGQSVTASPQDQTINQPLPVMDAHTSTPAAHRLTVPAEPIHPADSSGQPAEQARTAGSSYGNRLPHTPAVIMAHRDFLDPVYQLLQNTQTVLAERRQELYRLETASLIPYHHMIPAGILYRESAQTTAPAGKNGPYSQIRPDHQPAGPAATAEGNRQAAQPLPRVNDQTVTDAAAFPVTHYATSAQPVNDQTVPVTPAFPVTQHSTSAQPVNDQTVPVTPAFPVTQHSISGQPVNDHSVPDTAARTAALMTTEPVAPGLIMAEPGTPALMKTESVPPELFFPLTDDLHPSASHVPHTWSSVYDSPFPAAAGRAARTGKAQKPEPQMLLTDHFYPAVQTPVSVSRALYPAVQTPVSVSRALQPAAHIPDVSGPQPGRDLLTGINTPPDPRLPPSPDLLAAQQTDILRTPDLSVAPEAADTAVRPGNVPQTVSRSRIQAWSSAFLRKIPPQDTAGASARQADPAWAGPDTQSVTPPAGTEIILKQIATARNRAQLRDLTCQISHYIQNTASPVTFHESMLQDPAIQNLLAYTEHLDTEQYRTFAKQLAEQIIADSRQTPPAPLAEHSARNRPPETDLWFPDRHTGSRICQFYPVIADTIQKYEQQRKSDWQAAVARFRISLPGYFVSADADSLPPPADTGCLPETDTAVYPAARVRPVHPAPRPHPSSASAPAGASLTYTSPGQTQQNDPATAAALRTQEEASQFRAMQE